MTSQTRILTVLGAAALLLTSPRLHAQGWETYPQGSFSPVYLAAHPDGTVAYAIQEGPAAIRRGVSGGTIWENVSVPVGCTSTDGIAVAPDGTVYLTGRRILADGTRDMRVWASNDSGDSWSVVGDFLTRAASNISVNAGGEVFLCTTRLNGTMQQYPIVRLVTYKGTANPAAPLGMDWTIVDDYSVANNYANFPNSLTIRPSADPAQPSEIWVAGHAVDAKTLKSSSIVPVLRRSLDGGATWTTPGSWPVPSGYSFGSGTWSVVAGASIDGTAFVSVGYGKKQGRSTQRFWLTYRSEDDGANWTLVDTLAAGTTYSYGPSQLAADSLGGVFISGDGMINASVDNGATWVTSSLPGTYSVVADLVGDVFANGFTAEGVIYKLPAPAN